MSKHVLTRAGRAAAAAPTGRPTAAAITAAAVTAAGLALAAAAPATAGGFAIYDQGGKASGMAGAFVAQADDPTAIFYNPGGLALAPKKKKAAAGVSALSRNEIQYQGLAPGIGAGTASQQGGDLQLPPHVYALKPVGDRGVAALGLFTPFDLATAWEVPATYAGRRVATEATITSYDVNPTYALKLTPRVGVGVGAVYRLSEVEVMRRFPGTDPTTGQVVDFASVDFTSDMEGGIGFNAGVLAKLGPKLALGFAYRSAIDVEYSGSGMLTQVLTGNDQLDELVAASLPFGQELAASTQLEFPATAAAGVAVGLGAASLVEIDVHWTGWSSVDRLAVVFPNDPEFGQVYPLALDDALAFRVGFRATLASQFQVRLGAALDESPQPTASTGALLADSDRMTVTAGIGRDWLDVAIGYYQLDERAVSDSVDGLNGNYSGSGFSIAVTLSK